MSRRRMFHVVLLGALALGVMDWLRVCASASGLALPGAARGLLAVLGLSACIGALLAALGSVLYEVEDRDRASVALPLAAALFVLVCAKVAPSKTVALLVLLVCIYAAKRVPEALTALVPALRSAGWLAGCFAVASLTLLPLASSAREPLEAQALWATIGTCALCLLVALLRPLRKLAWPAALLAPVVLLGFCAWVGFRVPSTPARVAADAEHPSVLLVTIDTLRADHVGAYGYAPARTPTLDGLAREGALFQEVVTHTFMTGPSHTSILSGLHPDRHGTTSNGTPLRPEVRIAADLFREQGYATAAFVGGYTATSEASGLPRRFAYSDDDLRAFRLLPASVLSTSSLALVASYALRIDPSAGGFDRPAGDVNAQALPWLEQNADKPFFAWVHYFDPHLPYTAPASYVADPAKSYRGVARGEWYGLSPGERSAIVRDQAAVEHMIDLYDAEIAYTDHELGRLLSFVRARVPKERLIIAVTADHGESLGEHAHYFARDLHDQTLLVPWILRAPGVPAGTRVAAQVRTMDVLPTLLELSQRPPAKVDGVSVAALARGQSHTPSGPAISREYAEENVHSRQAASVRWNGYKLIEEQAGWYSASSMEWAGPSTELYQLAQDPKELVNVADSQVQVRRELSGLLGGAGTRPAPRPKKMSDDTLRRLRSLGYAQ